MNTREIQACIRSVVSERAHDVSPKMVTAMAEAAADLILDAAFVNAVKKEFETASVDAGYDPSK
jgi:hypothetical protein